MIPATPPVGNGFKMVEFKEESKVSIEFKPPEEVTKLSSAVPIGRSVLFQLILEVHTASNLDRDFSISLPIIAGSSANTRIASEPPAPLPVKLTKVS